jgi:deferrochelatase/peroxidase EfeB
VLGYRNEYDMYPDSPSVAAGSPGAELLGEGREAGTKDLGRNGSYLVFRQLEQDVAAFWRFLKERAGGRAREAVWLGAKMVGRWPNGAPLSLFPEEPPSDPGYVPTNDFLYLDEKTPGRGDPYGQKCPIGSHVRRTNPRDSLAPGPEKSLEVTRRHRILRRGRAYGAPLTPSTEPDALMDTPPDGVPRGLLFLCLNADIARQFEFIQQTWVVSPKFENLCSDPDPVIAPHLDPALAGSRPDEISNFTIPRDPVRRRETGLRRFVSMRGGAYFFVPGLSALRYLAALR